MESINLKQKSKDARLSILRLANKSQKVGAHIAPSLSIVEILTSVFSKYDRMFDAVVLSKGHAGLALYSAMQQYNLISKEQLDTFEDNGGEFPGQPTKTSTNAVIYSSGSLGLGLSYAAGLAYAKKSKRENGTIFVILGNGEMNEGTNYEALMFIKYHNLSNICIIIDDNSMQSDGETSKIIDLDLNRVCKGFGFNVIECNGHNEDEICNSIDLSKNECTVIICKTIKGKGVSFMENNNEWHHNNLKDEQYELAKNEVLNA